MWDEFCGHFSKLECPMYNWEIFPPSQNDYVVNPESLGECLLLKIHMFMPQYQEQKEQ